MSKKRSNTNPVKDLFSYNCILDESLCVVSGCGKKLRGKHSGNLEKHIKSCHKEVYTNLLKEKHDPEEPEEKKEKAMVLNGVKLSSAQILFSCVRLVTEHGRPFSLMDDAAFQDLINPLIDALPARERFAINCKSIRDRVPDIATVVRNYISNELKEKLVPLKLDGASLQSRSFMGINVQFIKDAKVVVRTLAVTELFSRHTALHLKSELLSTLDTYSLQIADLITSTTDTGANYLKIGELLRDAQIGEVDPEKWFPEFEDCALQVVRCLAHTMQLAVEDALKDQKYVKLFDKFRTAVRHCRTPTVARLLKTAGLPIPVMDVITRWGSSFDMALSLRNLKGFLTKEKNDQEGNHEEMNEDNENTKEKWLLKGEDWDLLDEVIEALRPAREATTVVQGEQLLPGDFYAQWCRCKLRTAKVDSDLARAIVQNLNEREKKKINKKGQEKLPSLFEYPGFLSGLLLDPRYFMILDMEQIDQAKVYLSNLSKRLQERKTPLTSTPSISAMDTVLNNDDDDDSDSELDAFLRKRSLEVGEKVQAHTVPPHSNIHLLIDSYLKTTKPLNRKTQNVLEFWESQRLMSPLLYELAQTVLAIPLTQVSVERLFSALHFILNPLRYNLTPQIVNDILVINANRQILEVPSIKAQISELLRSRSPSTGTTSTSGSLSGTDSSNFSIDDCFN